jgi:hypothetical protein
MYEFPDLEQIFPKMGTKGRRRRNKIPLKVENKRYESDELL